jgi:hypothetical protein
VTSNFAFKVGHEFKTCLLSWLDFEQPLKLSAWLGYDDVGGKKRPLKVKG